MSLPAIKEGWQWECRFIGEGIAEKMQSEDTNVIKSSKISVEKR